MGCADQARTWPDAHRDGLYLRGPPPPRRRGLSGGSSPDVELVNPATPLEGPITGHEGIRRFFRELWTHSDASDFQLGEIGPFDKTG